MIELLGSIFEFAFEIVGLVLTIVFDALGLVFGLLGGLLSLLLTLGGFALIAALVILFIRRRQKNEQPRQKVFRDQNGEEFVSFYSEQQ